MHSGLSGIYGLEGVFLNISIDELGEKLEIDREDLQPSVSFLNTLRKAHGTFSGFRYNKNLKELLLFTDQTSSRQIFYYSGIEIFVFSSSIFMLCDLLRQINIMPTLNEPASYMCLSIGFLLKDYTLVNEIKKLEAGKYLIVSEKNTLIKEYHNYYRPIIHNRITKDLLEELDARFIKSIKIEYQFDINNGFKHLATLSGGLDSRMNLMAAWDNGYKAITALTFDEGMQSDELVSRVITNDLKIQHIIILLNNGLHLFDLENPLMLNNCAVFYFGAAHTFSAVQKLNFNSFGLLHNGILAESSKGTYLSGPEHKLPEHAKQWSVSGKLLSRIQSLINNEIAGSYPNEEMFIHYSRGFNAAHNGSWMARPFAESVYTFMEPDFAELAFSINPKLRYKSFLTINWLKILHHDISKYKRAPNGFRPTNSQVKMLIERALRKTGRIITGNNFNRDPLNYWYVSNRLLRKFILENFSDSQSWNIISPEMKRDVEMLFKTGTTSEKMLCISFLKSLELLFLNTK
jgi:asparagine synthase (glutamine-hydrolysing)